MYNFEKKVRKWSSSQENGWNISQSFRITKRASRVTFRLPSG